MIFSKNNNNLLIMKNHLINEYKNENYMKIIKIVKNGTNYF